MPTFTPVTTPPLETVAIVASAVAQTILCPWIALPDASSTSAVSGTLGANGNGRRRRRNHHRSDRATVGSSESLLHEMAATMISARHRLIDCKNVITVGNCRKSANNLHAFQTESHQPMVDGIPLT